MRRLLAVVLATLALFATAAPSAWAQQPPQQGCPAFEIQRFREGVGGRGVGEAHHAFATPGTPGGVGQVIQEFCYPRPFPRG